MARPAPVGLLINGLFNELFPIVVLKRRLSLARMRRLLPSAGEPLRGFIGRKRGGVQEISIVIRLLIARVV